MRGPEVNKCLKNWSACYAFLEVGDRIYGERGQKEIFKVKQKASLCDMLYAY